jgi:hypothetical protein
MDLESNRFGLCLSIIAQRLTSRTPSPQILSKISRKTLYDKITYLYKTQIYNPPCRIPPSNPVLATPLY